MNQQILISYKDAKKYIKEADVLLFRQPGFPSVGFWITRYTGGEHSHVGLAHWDNGELECVEQREFVGGRSIDMDEYIKGNEGKIDVYRASPVIYKHKGEILSDGSYNSMWKDYYLDEKTKLAIVRRAQKITGQNYGWDSIWGIFKGYAPGFRLLRKNKNGDDKVSKAYVCSTVITYSYRMEYKDPCPNLPDDRTTPADIAQSSLFNYMFTLT